MMRLLVPLLDVRSLSSAKKKKKEVAEVAVVERVEGAATDLAKKRAAAPATPVASSSYQGAEARPQEGPAVSAGLSLLAPILTATGEVARPPEPPTLPAAVASPALVPRKSPLLPGAQLGHGAPAASGALEEALAALNLLQGELQGPDRATS